MDELAGWLASPAVVDRVTAWAKAIEDWVKSGQAKKDIHAWAEWLAAKFEQIVGFIEKWAGKLGEVAKWLEEKIVPWLKWIEEHAATIGEIFAALWVAKMLAGIAQIGLALTATMGAGAGTMLGALFGSAFVVAALPLIAALWAYWPTATGNKAEEEAEKKLGEEARRRAGAKAAPVVPQGPDEAPAPDPTNPNAVIKQNPLTPEQAAAKKLYYNLTPAQAQQLLDTGSGLSDAQQDALRERAARPHSYSGLPMPVSPFSSGDHDPNIEAIWLGLQHWWAGSSAFRPLMVFAEDVYNRLEDMLREVFGLGPVTKARALVPVKAAVTSRAATNQTQATVNAQAVALAALVRSAVPAAATTRWPR